MMLGFQIVEIILLTFFGLTVLYTLFFSFAGHLSKPSLASNETSFHRIAILIPAYKEDSVIVGAARSMLALDYPKGNYRVFVIADKLQPDTLDQLSKLPIEVVPVSFEKSTKTKSLNHCLAQINHAEFDLVLISDADNILEKTFLKRINSAFLQGHTAVQGRRVAKNSDTHLAVLDGASEAINNHIFRQGPANLGLSASLIGSAMVFKIDDVTEALSNIQAVGGFDKVLQLSIIEKGNTIHYLPEAIAYDEKVSNHGNFQNQRKRWLYSQYRYLAKFFFKGWAMLLKGNIDYFNIAILHNLFLPRVLNLGLLPILMILSFSAQGYLFIPPMYWVLTTSMYCIALALALPKRYYTWRVIKALAALPKGFFGMFLLLFKLKGADKQFIHTTHSQSQIEGNSMVADENK